MQRTQNIHDVAVATPMPLDGTSNTRDLGGYPTLYGQTTVHGRFFRSDALHELTTGSGIYLARKGIRCVVDLRTDKEISRHPDAFSQDFKPIYIRVPLNDRVPDEKGELHRAENLPQLYVSILETQQGALRALFGLLARAKGDGILFHCQLGKDRTGLVAMLLLSLADVPARVILADYAASQHYMAEKLQRYRLCDVFSGKHVPDKLYRSQPEDMQPVLEYLEKRYHGARRYLRHIGCERQELEALQERLLVL